MDNCDNIIDENMDKMDSSTQEKMISECADAQLKHIAPVPDVDQAWRRFSGTSIVPKRQIRQKRVLWTVSSICAASVLALIVISIFWGKNSQDQEKILAFASNASSQNITLSVNGMTDDVNTHQTSGDTYIITDETADFKNAKAEFSETRTISTLRGKGYKVILSDGTTVLMNADTKLTFPTCFTGKQRTVRLEGEAYFQVTKDSKRPFVVCTDKTRTRVLGTEFNIKAYPLSQTHITLVEGSIVVNDIETLEKIELKPGQDAVLLDQNKFSIKNIDTKYYVQWKEGYFYFDDVTLYDLMQELGRWYNVDIEIESKQLMNYRLHFVADRNKPIDNVIDNLNRFSYLSVSKTGNKIFISKK